MRASESACASRLRFSAWRECPPRLSRIAASCSRERRRRVHPGNGCTRRRRESTRPWSCICSSRSDCPASQPAKQLVPRKTNSRRATSLRESNIRNEALSRPALERSRRNFQQSRCFIVGEDLFGDRRTVLTGAMIPVLVAPRSARAVRRNGARICYWDRRFVHLRSTRSSR